MIKQANLGNAGIASELAVWLWPDNTIEECMSEMEKLIASDRAAVFLAIYEGMAVGFAQCELRTDYVEGTESSPVGYLEGLFVKPGHRGMGYAKLLVAHCEQWAKNKGCTEFASDCELHNEESLAVHLKLGFKEVNRIICFTKKII
ncbi:aminoglycoside 6'-N-acetyltransferase [Ureibacillus aquaedulcis]|uniref:Aminoglycoside N(6')-acetyltransferase type 1 n=1 Tax=Ureibacillus aquaedulcis TaxID=3058421 RepID=A0ABT8GKN0_9BACL|nr:aminoglycoside 6'-N-acetyltransferase [Ureibacillus sp. BA0131]MDN4491976.1 GNAT family N-acetyltransferase [Ureibacillus sp. BA0131]